MSREKQIERISHELNMSGKSLDTIIPEECDKIAAILYDAGCRMQSEGEWHFYSDDFSGKQVTGWICGNCNKYSTGLRNYCPECGAKMKGGAE